MEATSSSDPRFTGFAHNPPSLENVANEFENAQLLSKMRPMLREVGLSLSSHNHWSTNHWAKLGGCQAILNSLHLRMATGFHWLRVFENEKNQVGDIELYSSNGPPSNMGPDILFVQLLTYKAGMTPKPVGNSYWLVPYITDTHVYMTYFTVAKPSGDDRKPGAVFATGNTKGDAMINRLVEKAKLRL